MVCLRHSEALQDRRLMLHSFIRSSAPSNESLLYSEVHRFGWIVSISTFKKPTSKSNTLLFCFVVYVVFALQIINTTCTGVTAIVHSAQLSASCQRHVFLLPFKGGRWAGGVTCHQFSLVLHDCECLLLDPDTQINSGWSNAVDTQHTTAIVWHHLLNTIKRYAAQNVGEFQDNA